MISKIKTVFFVACFLLFIRASKSYPFFLKWHGYDLDSACRFLAKEISKTKELKGSRLAILHFHPTTGPDTLMGVVLTRKLTIFVGKIERKFDLVERLEILRLMDEIEAFEDKEIDEWRKRLKADFVLLAEYSWLKDKRALDISYKIESTRDGKIIATSHIRLDANDEIVKLLTTPIPKESTSEKLDLLASFAGKKGRISLFVLRGGKRIPLLGETPVVYVGEKIGFSISPSINSKLYILNYDSLSDEVVFLYPIKNLKEMVSLKDKVYFFPECVDKKGISYEVYPPAGRACFKVIGVLSDLDINLTKGLSSKDGYYILKRADMAKFLRNLSLIPSASWWEDTINFWIMER